MRRLVIALLCTITVCRLVLAEEVIEAVPKDRQNWSFTDIEGKKHDPFSKKAAKILVVIFVTTECPIANYYQPTINRLAEQYQSKGVRFLLFHADPDVAAEKLKEHAKVFKIGVPVFADTDFVLAKRLKATTTPEAFVITGDGVTKYRGRIDGTYVAWGKKRRVPGSHDLKDALDAVLLGKAVLNPVTTPIGCYIPFELADPE